MDYDAYYDDHEVGDFLSDYYDEEDLEELLKAYQDGYYTQGEEEITRPPLTDLLSDCLLPTLTQTAQMLVPLYAMCFLFRLVCLFSRSGLLNKF